MVVDALRAYVQLASGLTEVTLERAKTAAKALVTQAGSLSEAPAESAAQVRAMADELMKTAKDNRDLVLGMIRTEVDRAVGAMGVVAAEDFAALQRRLSDLEERFRGGGQATATTPASDERSAEGSDDGTDDGTDATTATTLNDDSFAGGDSESPVGAAMESDLSGGAPAPDEPGLSGEAPAPDEPGLAGEAPTPDEPELSVEAPAPDEPKAAEAAPEAEPAAEPLAADAADAHEAAAEHSDEAGADSAASDATADFDIPTPIAVERVVAKKRAAEREWDDEALDSPSASSDDAAQDPSPPDVSTA